MVCNRCLEEKDEMQFQTDDSYYCNSCIKLFGQPSLMQTSDKSKSKQQSEINYQIVQVDSDIKEAVI